jgi:hypothetical protein
VLVPERDGKQAKRQSKEGAELCAPSLLFERCYKLGGQYERVSACAMLSIAESIPRLAIQGGGIKGLLSLND